VQQPLHQPRPVTLGEGGRQRQQFVQRQAQAVDVAPGVGLPAEALRGHVTEGADEVAAVGQAVGVIDLGQPEVRDPGGPLGVQQQVGRLDVAVQDAVPVGVLQRLGHLHPEPGDAAVILPLRLAAQLGGASGPAGRVRAGRSRRRRSPVLARPLKIAADQAVRRPEAERGVRVGCLRRLPAQPAHLVQHGVQPLAGDELHDEVVDAVLLADTEDRHNVAVMQPCRRPCLPAEPLQADGIGHGLRGQHLQGDAPAQRLLLRLVDHTHAAATHLTQQAVLPELSRRRPAGRRRRQGGLGLEALQRQQGGKEPANALGQGRVALGVFLGRRALAVAVPVQEGLGEIVERVLLRIAAHGPSSSKPPGICRSSSLSRSRARR
jgi:hypothetical protein